MSTKKVLMTATALVAGGLLVVTAAQAQDEEMMAEPITASISGYYNTAFIGYSGDDDAGDRGHSIQQNIEIQVGGSTTLDNGITVSASMDIRPGAADDSKVSLSGAFGEIAYGNFGSAARGTPSNPWGNALFNVNGAWFGPKGFDTGGGDPSGFQDKATKVAYTSPNFNGFTLGVSYAPEGEKGTYNSRCSAGTGLAPSGKCGTATENQQGEQVAVGLSFSEAVMGGTFAAGMTHETHTTEVVGGGACDDTAYNCDPDVLRAGASLSIGDISVGGSFVQGDEQGPGEATIQAAGAAYTMGSTAIDFGWARSSSDMSGDDSTIFSLGLGYNLGPGIDVAGAVQFGTDEGGAPNDGDNDWTAVLIGTSINF